MAKAQASAAVAPPLEVEPSGKKPEAVVTAVVDDRPPWEPAVEAVADAVSAPESTIKPVTAAPVEPTAQLVVESPVEVYQESVQPTGYDGVQEAVQKTVDGSVGQPIEETVDETIEEASEKPGQERAPLQTPEAAPAPAPIPLERFTPDNWIQLRRQLSIGASLGEIASHCLYLGRSGQQLNFLIDSDHNSLYDEPHQEQFSEALSDYFQQSVTVDITLGVAEKETPRAATTREKAERLVEAVDSLNQDPAVVKFKQLFDGVLDERSVRPID